MLNRRWCGAVISMLMLGIGLTFSPVANSQTVNQNACRTNDYAILYVGGIRTTHWEMIQERQALEFMVGPTYNGRKVVFRELTNRTSGWSLGLLDVVETVGLSIRDTQSTDFFSTRYDDLARLAEGDSAPLARLRTRSSPALVTQIDNVGTGLASLIVRATGGLATRQADADAITNRLQAYRETVYGRIPIIVGYSEGNFFATRLYDDIVKEIGEKSLAVVHIAPPTKELRGSYVLSSMDLLIRGYNIGLDKTHDVDFSSADGLGHGIRTTYLRGGSATSRPILNLITAAMDSAQTPNCNRTYLYEGTNFTRVWDAGDRFTSGRISAAVTIRGIGPGYSGIVDLRAFPEYLGGYDVKAYSSAYAPQSFVYSGSGPFGTIGRGSFTFAEGKIKDWTFYVPGSCPGVAAPAYMTCQSSHFVLDSTRRLYGVSEAAQSHIVPTGGQPFPQPIPDSIDYSGQSEASANWIYQEPEKQ
ncbi:MAG TPA: hypothetical protein VI168_06235 [Croceibacterium sp.]